MPGFTQFLCKVGIVLGAFLGLASTSGAFIARSYWIGFSRIGSGPPLFLTKASRLPPPLAPCTWIVLTVCQVLCEVCT